MTRNGKRRFFGSMILGSSLLLSALVTAPSCSAKNDESLVNPCESKLTCGAACDASNACATGQFCGTEKTCTAECVPGDGNCGSGKSCNGVGRCVTGPGVVLPVGTGGSSGTGVGGGSSGGNCPGADLQLDGQLPTVLLLVDQSSSMNARFGDSDRWQTLRTSLMAAAPTGIVDKLQAQVRFGLSLYSGRNGAAPCPELTNVAPALNNYPAINTAYPVPTDAIIDDTPTGESIDASVITLLAVQDPGPKVIVLATDGEPDTCAIPDADGAGAREVAVKAAQDAFATGIFTFYISVGNEISEQHATEMANVGQGFPRNDPTQRFYRANSQNELEAAFDTIVKGVRSCNFALDGAVTKGGETKGTVTLNDMPLVFDDPNGWKLITPTTVQLLGTACDTVMNDKTFKLGAYFDCGVVVPVRVPK